MQVGSCSFLTRIALFLGEQHARDWTENVVVTDDGQGKHRPTSLSAFVRQNCRQQWSRQGVVYHGKTVVTTLNTRLPGPTETRYDFPHRHPKSCRKLFFDAVTGILLCDFSSGTITISLSFSLSLI